MASAFLIRDVAPADHDAVRAVNDAAFGQSDEGELVAALRADGDVLFELLAEQDGTAVGHILFSRLAIERGGTASPLCASLAPMAVLPDRQRRGIGGALVDAGVARCRDAGLQAIVVVGHPDYYPRFGFSAEAAEGLEAPFSGDAFMALELEAGALRGGGKVRYARAFGL